MYSLTWVCFHLQVRSHAVLGLEHVLYKCSAPGTPFADVIT